MQCISLLLVLVCCLLKLYVGILAPFVCFLLISFYRSLQILSGTRISVPLKENLAFLAVGLYNTVFFIRQLFIQKVACSFQSVFTHPQRWALFQLYKSTPVWIPWCTAFVTTPACMMHTLRVEHFFSCTNPHLLEYLDALKRPPLPATEVFANHSLLVILCGCCTVLIIFCLHLTHLCSLPPALKLLLCF